MTFYKMQLGTINLYFVLKRQKFLALIFVHFKYNIGKINQTIVIFYSYMKSFL